MTDSALTSSWPVGQWSRFVRWLLGGAVVLVLGIFALNALVDPRGIYGVGIWKPIVVEAGARRAKAELLVKHTDPAPKWLILGSSTARNADPDALRDVLGLAPHTVFNAGVSAGKPIDAFVLADLAERQPGPMPKLLWLVDIDGTMADTAVDPGILATGSLRASLTRGEQLALLPTIVKPYVELDGLKLTARSVKADPLGRRDASTDPLDAFTRDGYRLESPYASETAERRTRRRIDEGAIYRDRFYSGSPAAAGKLGSDSREWSRRLLALADAHDVAPTIVLLPPHPDYRRSVVDRGWTKRRDAVRTWFEHESADHPLRLVDLSDNDGLGGDGAGYEDHVHLDQQSMTRLMQQVFANG